MGKGGHFPPKLDFHSWELLPQKVTAGNAEHGAKDPEQEASRYFVASNSGSGASP